MNHDKTQNCNPSDYVPEEDEINLLDLLLVLAKHKKMIIGTCLVTFVLTLGVTLLLPNIYSATAQILPPKNESSFYVSMLKSRTVADAIIEKFGLSEVYRKKSQSQTYESLDSHVSFSAGKNDGIIQIKVEDKDPKRAAEMANAFVEELKKLSDLVHLSRYTEQLQFLEKQLQIGSDDLANADQKLRIFQEKNQAGSFDDQSMDIIGSVSGLNNADMVELGRMAPVSQFEQTPIQLENQIRERKQSSVREKALGDIAEENANSAKVVLSYSLTLRAFRIQSEHYEALSRQLEQGRLEMAKSKPNIQVLSAVYVPDKKSKPKRSLIVLLATFTAGVFAVLVAFVREYGERMSDEDRQRWQEIRGLMWLRAGSKSRCQ